MATSPSLSISDPTRRLIAAIEARTGTSAKKVGKEWVVRCPVHRPDRNPSGNIRQGDAGYPVWRCRSQGCSFDDVLREVGMSWGDIFGNDDDRWTPNGPYVAVYDYVDENGEVLYQVCRTADKKFSQRRPNPQKQSGWEWSLNGTRRVPFRLPRVIMAAKLGEEVYIVEGEKDVLALEALGYIATCNSGGAGSWRPEFGPLLKGANVIVVTDKDEAGLKHSLAVTGSVSHFAKTIKLLEPKSGKDVSDHLDAGLTLDALIPLDTAEAERNLEALTDDQSPPEDDQEPEQRLVVLSGREFRAQPLLSIEPLIGDSDDALMMPYSLMLLAGIGGSGKTTLALHALAHWTAGLPWFGIHTTRPIRALVIENEGPHDPFVKKVDQFAERFKSCMCSGEPHGETFGLDDNTWVLDRPWGKFSFEDSGLSQELLAIVQEHDVDLVIANPLGRLGMRGAGAPEETRAFLQLLTNAGLGEHFAAMLVHHLAKANPNTPLTQQISGDWGPHPDTIMVMEPAGERRSKLTFSKVRWGDQGRAPLVLDWLTDSDGPVGYKIQGQLELSEEDRMSLQQRIDSFLSGQGEPVSMTNIKAAVKGKAQMIVNAVQQGIESGRYQTDGASRAKYWMTAQERVTNESYYEREPFLD